MAARMLPRKISVAPYSSFVNVFGQMTMGKQEASGLVIGTHMRLSKCPLNFAP